MRRSSLTWLGVAVLAAILAASGLATVASVRDGRDEAQAKRIAIAGPAIRTLAADVAQASASLEDLRAFFEASPEVSAEDFDRFAIAPLARQPALGYLAWTPMADGPIYLKQQPGAPDDAEAPSAAQTESTMDAARDQAVPRMTGPLTTPDGERVVVVVAAVYAPGAVIGTVTERRAALRGFASGVLRLATLGEAAQAGLPDGASIGVRDGTTVVVGAEDAGDVAGTVDVAGRRWTVGLIGVAGSSVALPITVGVAGVLLAAVVALLFAESASREREIATSSPGCACATT